MLRIKGLVKRYRTATCAQGYDLDVPDGQVMALIGPSAPASRLSSAASIGWSSRPLHISLNTLKLPRSPWRTSAAARQRMGISSRSTRWSSD